MDCVRSGGTYLTPAPIDMDIMKILTCSHVKKHREVLVDMQQLEKLISCGMPMMGMWVVQ